MTIDLINESKSDTKYDIIHFPDGQSHFKIDPYRDHKESHEDFWMMGHQSVDVKCRITNAEDLFILMQLNDILQNKNMELDNLYIYYMLAGRTDRRFSSDEPFTLKIVAEVINSMKAKHVYVIEPHSGVTCGLIDRSQAIDGISHPGYINSIISEKEEKNPDPSSPYETWICFPDKGAMNRYMKYIEYYNVAGFLKGSKIRDTQTGVLHGFSVERPDQENLLSEYDYNENVDILVIDDLCDGGGTFIGIANAIKEKFGPRHLYLAITHAVQLKGLKRVASAYDEVYITDAYRNWIETESNDDLPDNLHLIPITDLSIK